MLSHSKWNPYLAARRLLYLFLQKLNLPNWKKVKMKLETMNTICTPSSPIDVIGFKPHCGLLLFVWYKRKLSSE